MVNEELLRRFDALEALLERRLPPPKKPLRPGVLLCDAVFECLMDKVQAGHRPRYLRQLRSSLGQFSRSFGPDFPIGALTTYDVEKWIHSPAWKRRTKRNYVTDLRTFFAWCVQKEILRVNLAKPVSKPIAEDVPNGILSLKEIWHLLFVAKAVGIGPYFGVMLFAGIRPAEADRLRLQDFRDGAVIVEKGDSKTRKRRAVTIQPALAAWLEMCGPAEWPPRNRHKKMKAVRLALGRKWPHDALRNCFVSYGIPVFGASKVATWAGHDEETMFNDYAEIVTERQAESFWELSCYVPRRRLAVADRPAETQLELPFPGITAQKAPGEATWPRGREIPPRALHAPGDARQRAGTLQIRVQNKTISVRHVPRLCVSI